MKISITGKFHIEGLNFAHVGKDFEWAELEVIESCPVRLIQFKALKKSEEGK